MYRLMSGISILIRYFLLPNPFAYLENGELFNWAATIILLPITYGMVSVIYDRGSAPTFGSFLFLVIYLVNSAILLFCGFFKFHVIACAIIGMVYIAVFIVAARFINDFGRGY